MLMNMEQIKVIAGPKGTYSCNIGVSTAEWQEILANSEVTTTNYKYALMAFYNEPGHKSTCKRLSLKHYGNAKDAQKFNSWITNFGKAVVKHLNRFRIIDTDGTEKFWHVSMCSGRNTEDGLFETTLRPEIVSAIEALGWNKRLTTEKYSKYIEILKETHNLVLTGAPGTGKTFMAQSIAEEMGAETKFVQFHPSYDYTDFVEGLRPVDNGNGQIGFERKDGVFKEFCKNAIKNIADSEKSIENLTKELSWQDKLEQFVEDAMENEKKFKTVKGSEFSIADMKGHTIVVHNDQNEKTTDVTVNTDEILDLLTQEVELNNVRDIRSHYGRKFATQPDSYAFVIVKEIRKIKTEVSGVTADKVEKKPFVFIIDEINRGEVSKIFGELFYAIDPGYRGKTGVLIQTQYQNLVPESDVFAKGFYVPENVYILATMNDIDRSVESMDFAMRRRFTWQEVTPADTQEMLDSLSCADKAKDVMNRLNQEIAGTDGLGAAYMIGPSYFLKLKDNGDDFDKLWTMNIEPLLKEYLRGFRTATETLGQFKHAYDEETEDISDMFDEEN